MDQPAQDATEIKLHLNIIGRKGLKSAKHGIPTPDYYGSPTDMAEENLKKRMLQRKQNNRQQGHQVHGDRLELDK
jgi:hypothetical protein